MEDSNITEPKVMEVLEWSYDKAINGLTSRERKYISKL